MSWGITLASASPRRREIVSAICNPVSVSDSRGDEPRPADGESPIAYATRAAAAKLGDMPCEGSDGYIVGADTVVALDGRIFGKPSTDEEARWMLRQLRDRRHEVTTGVAVMDTRSGRVRTGGETSSVLTRDYSDESIEAYIASGEPFDKAGGYAAQDEEFGPVVRVEGCYLNVVGLPLCLLETLMAGFGRRLELRPPRAIPYYDRCEGCKLAGVGRE